MDIEVMEIVKSREGNMLTGVDRFIWTFRLAGRQHTVELRLLSMGKKQVFVDGQLKVDDRLLLSNNIKYPFELDNNYFFLQRDDENFDICLQSCEWRCFKRIKAD